MTEITGTLRSRRSGVDFDRRALLRRGEVEGMLGVDLLLRRLAWRSSKLETRGGEILTVKPLEANDGQPFFQFFVPDAQKGELHSRVRFDSGASGVEVTLGKVAHGVSLQGENVIIESEVGDREGKLSINYEGQVDFRIPGSSKKSELDNLEIHKGEPGGNSTVVYKVGEDGLVVINNVNPDQIKTTDEGTAIQAQNEYGTVFANFGKNGLVHVVLVKKT